MEQFTIVYATPKFDFDEKYGQKYRGKVKESDLPVEFNLMNPVNFDEGDIIEYTEKLLKKWASTGQEYIFLRKVKRSGSGEVQQSAERSSPTPTTNEKSTTSAAGSQDNKYLKDVSDTPKDLLKSLMQYEDYRKIKDDKEYRRVFLELVADLSNELLVMTENIRSGVKVAETAHKSGIEKARETANRLRTVTANEPAEEEVDLNDIFPEE